MRRVLILAGSAEARAVCAAVADLDVLASFAGRTEAPSGCPVPVRVGGFGGEDGFRAALRGVAAVLDATHPFAAVMSARAARVCAAAEVPHLRLTRPPFAPRAGWRRAADAGAVVLPAGARVLLTVGPGSLAPFLGRGCTLFCRRIEAAAPVPGVTWIVGRPPFDVGAERHLMAAHAITDLVTKDSGGPAAKFDAAESLGIAVHVIDRPRAPPGCATHDVDRAIAFLRAHAGPRP